MYCGPADHDWEADPEHRGEGLICARCGVSEAELEAADGWYDDDGWHEAAS